MSDIHRRIFDNLTDGVIVVRRGGVIDTLNPAAERLLGLRPGEAENASFAELLIAREGFDELTQFVLEVGAGRVADAGGSVEIRSGETKRLFSVAAFRIARAAGADAIGVVFSDLTEVRALRDTEVRMAREAQAQHRRLRDAYRAIEGRNAALAAALRRVRIIQGGGIALALGLFAVAGLWAWLPLDTFELPGGAAADAEHAPAPVARFEVAPRPVSSSVLLKGRLQPWRTVVVTSPVEGTVASLHFRTGEEVTPGQMLVEMDVREAQSEYPGKLAAHAEAARLVADLESWEHSAEMSAARRTLRRAELDLESGRTKLNSSRFLFEQGLIPASQFEDEERRHQVQLLDHEAAREEFEAVRSRGSAEALDAARLALSAAAAELRANRETIASARVTAPIAGIVMAPSVTGRGASEGLPVSPGQSLLEIGDFARLAVVASADESDVVRLRVGQPVKVTGDAFPALSLDGAVSHVSSQADQRSRNIPTFEFVVTLDPLGPEEAGQLRAGMSANLEIIVYHNPQALLVPVRAVRRRGGEYRLGIVDPASGAIEERAVAIGPTTLGRVEIVSGLRAGEHVAVPES